MFGHTIPKDQHSIYLDRLQRIINSFDVKIQVRECTSYTNLMERLMYETGCFYDVYEITGPIDDRIREQRVFSVPHTAFISTFYRKEKLYYIDINGAYLSTVNSIPTGRCGHDLVFKSSNTKIKDVIERLYDILDFDF